MANNFSAWQKVEIEVGKYFVGFSLRVEHGIVLQRKLFYAVVFSLHIPCCKICAILDNVCVEHKVKKKTNSKYFDKHGWIEFWCGKVQYANERRRKCTIQFAKCLVHSADHLGLQPKAKEGHKNVKVYFNKYGKTLQPC